MSNLNIAKSVVLNGMSYIVKIDGGTSRPDRYSKAVKGRMYISNRDEGFTLYESIMARGSEPHRWYRKHLLPIVAEVLKQNNIGRDVKFSWSRKAGCGMCPCSPGYVISGLDYYEIWVSFGLDDDFLLQVDGEIADWNAVNDNAYKLMEAAKVLPYQINSGWTTEEREEAEEISAERAPRETAMRNIAQKRLAILMQTRKDRVMALYTDNGKEQIKGDETHRTV